MRLASRSSAILRRQPIALASLLLAIVIARAGLSGSHSEATRRLDLGERPDRLPNVIVVLADDMGFGDTGFGGHTSIRTPHLDAMAREGQVWTNFYVAASVCSPSRAGLLTGRLPVRSGVASSTRRVFFPDSAGGLPQAEWTLAELFRSKGYATASIGKWHLGHEPEFLPTRHGFDEWFGIPYSNDMDKTPEARRALRVPREGESPAAAWLAPRSEWFQVPLMRGDSVVERAPDQRFLTQRYTDEAVAFVERSGERPFFLYVAFSMPHVPLFRSQDFAGRSRAGLYGDVIEELDFAVGRLLGAVRDLANERDTLVFFTSDNGPWREFGDLAGSAGPFRGGKSTAWEGGFRVPALFWSPGRIEPGRVEAMASTLDLLPTFAALIDAELVDNQLDGFDLTPALSGTAQPPRESMFFYLGDELAAIRQGRYKAHFLTKVSDSHRVEPLETPLLFDLETDPSERFDLAAEQPQVVAALVDLAETHRAGIVPVENQLLRR